MNNGKEIARVTLGSQSPDTAAALETCARLGVRVEAVLTPGSSLIIFKALPAYETVNETRAANGLLPL